MAFSCQKPDPPAVQSILPELTTYAATGITCYAAVSGGNVTDTGASAVTARGICYGTSANPTIANTVIPAGAGTGAFSSNLPGLAPGTTYHVRAFATNSAGTSYGNDIFFTTTSGCPVDLYIAGSSDVYNASSSTYMPAPAYWKNNSGSFERVLLPIPPRYPQATLGAAHDIFVSGTDVYVAGHQNYTACVWKNGVRTDLGTGFGIAHAVFVSGTDVYVAGEDAARAYIWKNGVPTSLSNESSQIFSILVSGTDVYAAGAESQYVGGNYTPLATVWKNGIKSTLTAGPAVSGAGSLFISGPDVYVSGSEGMRARLWKNGIPLSLTSTYASSALSVFVNGADVYAAGYEDAGNTSYSYARLWKNGVPTNLTPGGYNFKARDVKVIGNDVYVVGHITGFYAQVALWKNGVQTNITNSGENLAYALFIK